MLVRKRWTLQTRVRRGQNYRLEWTRGRFRDAQNLQREHSRCAHVAIWGTTVIGGGARERVKNAGVAKQMTHVPQVEAPRWISRG